MRILSFICLFVAFMASAQVSNNGRFSADYVRGCVPLTVNLTEIVDLGAIDRQYLYETPNNEIGSINLTHTYNQPGVYQIVQIPASNDLVPKTDTLTIEVFAQTAPQFTYLYCGNRGVQVKITDPTYDSYEVVFANNTSIYLNDGETGNHTFGLSDPLSIQVTGMYTGAPDNCAESLLILPEIKGTLIAPTPISANISQPCEGEFQLDVLTTFEEDVLYEIEISKSGSSYVQLFEGLLSPSITFENLDFSTTETSYCVRINALNVCNGTRVLGTSACTTLQSDNLAPVRNLFSTYAGESIAIVLDPIDQGTFIFQRTFNWVTYGTLHTGQQSYTDNSPFLGRQYSYRVSYTDICNNQWGIRETNPPFIRAEAQEANHYLIIFTPAVHTLDADFTYEAHLTGPTGSEIIPITDHSFELALPPTLGEKQQLEIVGTAGDVVIRSNQIKFTFEFVVYVPKAFTPNSDGLNDRLEVFGLGGARAYFNVYNRWGQQIYGEFSSSPSWDGRINGRLADEGVYIYEISVPEQPNHIQKGTFVLIKK